MMAAELPPLRGVVHAAGVLADGLLFDMDLDALDRAMLPKTVGSWNLHVATQDAPLDFFVLFSSVACVLGSPGQANYAAGNAFLDGLAAYRRRRALPALSVNWGPWAGSGMAVAAGVEDQMRRGASIRWLLGSHSSCSKVCSARNRPMRSSWTCAGQSS